MEIGTFLRITFLLCFKTAFFWSRVELFNCLAQSGFLRFIWRSDILNQMCQKHIFAIIQQFLHRLHLLQVLLHLFLLLGILISILPLSWYRFNLFLNSFTVLLKIIWILLYIIFSYQQLLANKSITFYIMAHHLLFEELHGVLPFSSMGKIVFVIRRCTVDAVCLKALNYVL